MFEGLLNSGTLDMALRKIRDREAPSDRCNHCIKYDLCALNKWRAMKWCLDILGSLGIKIWWLGCPGQILPRTLDGQWSNGKHAALTKKKKMHFSPNFRIFSFMVHANATNLTIRWKMYLPAKNCMQRLLDLIKKRRIRCISMRTMTILVRQNAFLVRHNTI
jgi:hypothetical protein